MCVQCVPSHRHFFELAICFFGLIRCDLVCAWLQTLFEADPKLWQTGSFASAAAHNGPLMPFAQGTVRQIKMDLVQLADTGNTHMVISADSIAIDDLRLAYSQIMNNHISEQQSSSTAASPSEAADAIPASSPLVARVPSGVMARRKSDVGSRPRDTSASDLRQSISARDVPLSSEVTHDRDRARAALSRTSAEVHRAHSVPSSSATKSPQLPRNQGKALPKAKRKPQGASTQESGELVSIISMEVVPELLDMLPDGAPVVHLVQCPYKPPADEGAHLKTHVPVPGRDIDRIEVCSYAAFSRLCWFAASRTTVQTRPSGPMMSSYLSCRQSWLTCKGYMSPYTLPVCSQTDCFCRLDAGSTVCH